MTTPSIELKKTWGLCMLTTPALLVQLLKGLFNKPYSRVATAVPSRAFFEWFQYSGI